ncbi:DUF6777 domain-containing protein [Streptomyces sp. TUS-ST3]|uniref:DUF6777 domain-containing protein n=1 Tax=Streptomyces sp. TUS-ST3 TaxID=3025591 RepID=UPI0024E0EB6E|nr:DUF6777 domain-containing protein [Streptomyces sp. TUS-ST3]
MRTPTRTLAVAGVLTAALLVAGCGAGGVGGEGGDGGGEPSGKLLLQPAAAQGPNPFTRSAATAPSSPARTPRRDPSAPRTVSGGTPGLYGGTERVGSCAVERQIADLTADRSRTNAFAGVAGVSPAAVPDYLRRLAPVVLRADTRVTDHGYRDGRASGFQSVLQAGTAVLVDDRGVPRVRCACGNPLTPPVPLRSGAVVDGRPWSGYRPAQVIVVTPGEQVMTELTIIDSARHTWIERRIDHDCRHDHVVPPPRPEPPTPTPAPTASPGDGTPFAPLRPAPDCASPTAPVVPGTTVPVAPGTTAPGEPYDERCPASTGTTALPPATMPPATMPPATLPPATRPPATPPETPEVPSDGARPAVPVDPETEIGPETVPDTPDLPDGGGLIPDEPAAPTGAGTLLDSPTDIFGV